MPTARRAQPTVLVAPDKLRGTLGAVDAASAISAAAPGARWAADSCPLSDGGDGFVQVMGRPGGRLWAATVCGPLGQAVVAHWLLDGPLAVVESATASGLELAGGPAGNRPLEATSRGTGELVAAAVESGARRVVVGVGGTATTDGGLGALEALEEAGGTGDVELVVACDVRTGFLDAAERFGPQKGAGAEERSVLGERLVELAEWYRRRYGVDVTTLPGSGAGGGLVGGLAAIGARLVAGFEVVADRVDLAARLRVAALAIGAEGRLDASSWEGKVVGGLAGRSAAAGVPMVVLAGSADHEGLEGAATRGIEVVILEDRYGEARARRQTARCLADAAARVLKERGPGR
ncbi:MAG TPA: glycerate kinase [Acidimicrobiales bacterium]|nr:glycerate kinase [Acidimicrobiales bacterium]